MRNLFFLVFIIITVISHAQEKKYVGSTVYVSPFYDQIIESEYQESGEAYFAPPVKSSLYTLPINCSKVVELVPCNNYNWFSSNKYIYGENTGERKVYLFNKSGEVFKEINNAELFSYYGGNHVIFIREYLSWSNSDRINPQIIVYDIEENEENVLFEFDKEKYTFHSPNAHNGPGLPEKLSFSYGKVSGKIFSTDWNYEGEFSFVIDIQANDVRITEEE